jgi:hypothetical protein
VFRTSERNRDAPVKSLWHQIVTSFFRADFQTYLILLSGFFAIPFGGLDRTHVQGSVDYDLQTFSLVDCPELSSEEEGTNNGDDDNGQNIELQIPSIIPFP